jgi:hypothetical protein
MVGRLSVERSFNVDVRTRKFKGLNARAVKKSTAKKKAAKKFKGVRRER